MEKSDDRRHVGRTVNVSTTNLEMPSELAYLMEKAMDVPPMHTERNWISAVGRVPTFPSVKNNLPDDINSYVLPKFFKDHGIDFQLGFKTKPLEEPIVPKTTADLTKKSLEAFKLILRFTFDDTLTQTQEYLLGSYIVHLAMQNLEMRQEIYLQVMNQCINYNDEVGLKKLWLLMANLLSACKPGDRVENYVIKFVSDHGILEWNTLCQMKILSARPQCRLFPPCSLEWKSNTKSARVALPVQFLDGQTIVLDVDSFTIAEDVARHALSIKADSVHGLKGWSVALQFDNEINEMGGHGYVLDPLSCAELRSEWNKIGGSTGSMFFLISKDVNRSPRANMRSTELDSWLEDVFDQALTSDRSTDSKKVSGWIHGLGDQMPIPTMPYLQGSIGVPLIGATAVPQVMPNMSTFVGVPDAMVQAQTTAQLQTAIQQAQLQNTLLQQNVQREMLVSQLNQLQTANTQQLQRSQVQLQQTMASPPILQMPGAELQSQQSVVSQPSLSTPQSTNSPPNLGKTQTQHISVVSTSVFDDSTRTQEENKFDTSTPVSNAAESVEIEATPVNVDASTRSLSSRETVSPESGRLSPARGQSQSDEVLKNRAKTVRIGRVSWPPPPKDSSLQENRPEPKRLPIERDPEVLRKSSQPKEATTKVQRTSAPVPISSPVKEHSSARPSTVHTSKIPNSSTAASKPSTTSLSTFKASDPKSPPPVSSSNSRLLTKRDSITLMNQVTERNVTPPSSAPAVILTEEDFSHDRTPSRARAEEVPHVDVAVRARQLANQLFLGNSETVVASNGNSDNDSWFGHHKTILLEAGPDTRHYMYTMVPWKLIVRKEIFSPGERMESPMLLDLLFSQIVYDTLKQPCIRLSVDEKRKIKTLIDNHNINTDLSNLKRQSNMVKKTFIDAAKAARFYFGRFYAAEWHNPNTNFYPVHWVVVNHAGIHLVHHQEDDELQSLKTLQFQEILTVSKVDSRMLSLSTRDNDRYDLICHMVGSLKSLIEMYMEEAERTPKGVDLLVRRNSSIEQLKNRSGSEAVMMRSAEVIVENGAAPNQRKQQSDAGYDDMVEYGMQYFRVRDSRSKVDDLLRWGKSPLQTSLHPFDNAEDDRLSVEAFLAILTFMHEYPMERETNIVDYALVLLEIPMRRKNLIDEIYCLLVKQTRAVDEEHPVRENLASCWRLLSLFAMFFDCSDKLRPYLTKYLQNMMKKEEFEGVAVTTLKNLEQSQKYGGRKLLPLRSELDAEINGYSAKRIQLAMPRGLKAAVQLTPISVVDEIVDELCSSLGVTDELEKSEFTIFTVLTKENISSPLRGEQYAFDVITDITMTGRPFHFFFCRTSWVADLQLRKRSGELIDLFYKQVMDDYLSGNWLLYPIGEGVIHQARDISRLIAIQQKINNALATTITSKELKAIVPNGLARFQTLRDHEWLASAKAQLRQLVRYTSTECKADALEILAGWFLFGSMCFHVQTGMQSVIPNQSIILCLCRSGLVLLEKGTHKFLLNIPFSEVFSYEVTIDPNGPTQLDLKVSNDRTICCFSNQANKIVHVLNQYMKLSSGA